MPNFEICLHWCYELSRLLAILNFFSVCDLCIICFSVRHIKSLFLNLPSYVKSIKCLFIDLILRNWILALRIINIFNWQITLQTHSFMFLQSTWICPYYFFQKILQQCKGHQMRWLYLILHKFGHNWNSSVLISPNL